MPPLEYADHYQDAVLWEAAGFNAYGKRTVSDSVGIKVRWESVYREVITDKGETVAISHVVHTSREIPVGSILWKGKVSQLPAGTADPGDLYEVVLSEETPSLKNRFVNRSLSLARFRDSLPDSA